MILPYLLSCVKNHVYLSRGVQVTGATWWTAMRIMTGVGDLVQMTEDNQVHIGYSVTRKLGGRVMFCTVCTVHKETRSVSFLVWTQNQGRRLLLV
jgi:hypothetical protein